VRKQLLCVSIAAALALSLSGSSASAHDVVLQNSLVFDTPVSIGTTTYYSGQVFGPKECKSGRLVDIYVGGLLLTTVTTFDSGLFSATGPKPPPGTEATAIVRKKVSKTRKHGKHKCPQKMETKKVQQ
jgi:hypothetical protein